MTQPHSANTEAVADRVASNFDPQSILGDFPILDQKIHRDRRLIYLDNAASTQRPQQVIDAIVNCYQTSYANVHRGIHYLSELSTREYEEARAKVQKLIGAEHSNEIVFTPGSTLGFNIVAYAWGDQHLGPQDELILTEMEHHSNIVPWQQLAERQGCSIKWARVTDDGLLDLDHFRNLLSSKTRVVAFTALSNTLGTRNPVQQIVELAHDAGAIAVVDAAQHVPHETTDVTQWDADFVCFSAHKMLGPSGIGVLYGKQNLLESMPPFLGGGSMISTVTQEGFTPGALPARFEAGTPPIAQTVGFSAAIDYLDKIGLATVAQHEHALTSRAMKQMSDIEGLKILGPPADQRAGIISFVVEGVHPQDLSVFIDRQGVAIRAGHHCTMPLHQRFGISASCRASFYLYNTVQDVDEFVAALTAVIAKLK